MIDFIRDEDESDLEVDWPAFGKYLDSLFQIGSNDEIDDDEGSLPFYPE